MDELKTFLIVLSIISIIVLIGSVIYFISPTSAKKIVDIESTILYGELSQDASLTINSPISSYKDLVNVSQEVKVFGKSISNYNNILVIMPSEIPVIYTPKGDNVFKFEIQIENLGTGINASLLGEGLSPKGYTGEFVFNSSLKNFIQFNDREFAPVITWTYSTNYLEVWKNYTETDKTTEEETITPIKDKVYTNYKATDTTALKTYFDREAYLDPNMSTCGTIPAPGVYNLTASISNYGATCIIINSSDVIFDCLNNIIDGKDLTFTYGIYVSGIGTLTNITIQNCPINDFYNAINMENVISSFVTNINATSQHNGGKPLTLTTVTYSIFTNISIFNQTGASITNILLGSYSQYNNFTNGYITGGYNGISFGSYCSDNIINGFNITKETNYGLSIVGNTNNKFFNNFFNNTNNTYIVAGTSYWNTTLTAGTNIIGGSNIGGNFWANSTGGFSETCTDADVNGICDAIYNVSGTSVNIDYLPLAKVSGVADTTYPTFSTYGDDNNTLFGSGIAHFNVTLLNTNGTVYLNINGTKVMATNSTAYVYNTTFFLVNGTYNYNWSSYGNGTSHLLNYSIQRSYTLNPDVQYPQFSNYWDNNATITQSGTGRFNVTLLNTNGTVLLYINGTNYTASNSTSNVYNTSAPFVTGGSYDYYWISWGNGTLHKYNQSSLRSYYVYPPDTNYPQFSNFTTIPANSTAYSDGVYSFNATILNSNGTAGIEFNGVNYTATNLSYVFNRTFYLNSYGTYNYYWWAYGNGTLHRFNVTALKSYTIQKPYIDINITYPLNGTDYLEISYEMNYTINSSNLSTCSYSTDGGVTYNLISACGINVTGLSSIQGWNTWSICANDSFGNINCSTTRFYGDFIDIIPPNATLLYPTTNQLNATAIQNFTANFTDNIGLRNATLFIYNITGLYNWSTISSFGGVTDKIAGITVFLSDGGYNWSYQVFDNVGNSFTTENFTITIDTTSPLISYGIGTEVNGANVSQNWIYVNVSFIEPNFANITFSLFNDTDVVNSTTFNSTIYNINWTNLQEGNYSYQINITDTLNHENATEVRTITLDKTNPLISYGTGTESSGTNFSRTNIYVNTTFTELHFANITFSLFNDTSIINTTIFTIPTYEINWTNLADNNYSYQINITDSANNKNFTELRTIILDTTNPLISYGIGTLASGINISNNFIYVNTSWTELHFANITFSLFNDTNVVNSTTFSTPTYFINWTGLIDNNYSYQVNISDFLSHVASTEVRFIRLDITAPNATLISPVNGSLNTTQIQNFTANVSDNNMLKNATLYIYNQTGIYNVSTTNIVGKGGILGWITTLIDGIYTWFVEVFDVVGNGFRTGNYTVTIDMTPPYFTNFNNKTIYNDEALSYTIGASDAMTSISCFTVNNTYNFSINCAGLLTSNSGLELGINYLNITVNDTLNNLLSGVIWVNVLNYSLVPTEPFTWYNNSESPQNRLFAISEGGDVILERNGTISRRRVDTSLWFGDSGNLFVKFGN